MESPQFPEKVWQLGVEGEVIARVFVDEDGNPVKIKILKSSNSMLVAPVTEAVMKWKFSPATMSKGPIAAWVTIPLKFKKNK